MLIASAQTNGDGLLSLANGVAHLYKVSFGRGPSRTTARYAGEDMVLVSLQGVLAPAERALVDLGELARVREARILLQEALAPALRELVLRTLGRPARSCVTGIDPATDVAIEVLML